jgi:prepilin-type N-terminal cleavage/methylation domain-containing protein
MKRHTRSGFTLIELLIVVLIIAVLVVVLVAVLLAARGKGDIRACENFVNNVITDSVYRWQADARGGASDQYPPSGPHRIGDPGQFEGNAMLFQEFILYPEKSGREPYLGKDQFARGQLSNGKEVFMDPWGTPYIYRNFAMKKAKDGSSNTFSGKIHNAGGYDMISAGPDQKFDTEDDIWNGK